MHVNGRHDFTVGEEMDWSDDLSLCDTGNRPTDKLNG